MLFQALTLSITQHLKLEVNDWFMEMLPKERLGMSSMCKSH